MINETGYIHTIYNKTYHLHDAEHTIVYIISEDFARENARKEVVE